MQAREQSTGQTEAAEAFASHTGMVLRELHELLQQVRPLEIAAGLALLAQANSVFFFGAGRSGLSLEMAAMRWMHLGRRVHVAGEVTCPAIAKGDVLFVASASGKTESVVRAVEVALAAGAQVLAITAAPESRLREAATACITLAAAHKLQHGDQSSPRASEQYAGSLFEQGVLLLCDALFHGLWKQSEASAAQLMARHANLE
jgi:6-phospho-3-hexuloisomerase